MKAITLVCVALLFSGCSNIDVSVFGKSENIRTLIHRKATNKNVVIHLELGTPQKPYSASPKVQLKFPNGEVLSLSSFDMKLAEKHFDEAKTYARSSFTGVISKESWDNKKPFKVISLRNYPSDLSITLIQKEQEIHYAYFRCASYNETKPPFSIKVDNSEWCNFPLRKVKLESLFGKKQSEYSYLDWQ